MHRARSRGITDPGQDGGTLATKSLTYACHYQRIVTYMVLTAPERPASPMALDRSFDDGADQPDVQPDQHLRHSASSGDAPVSRAEPAEHRSHAEYYEALRAADGKSADSDDGRRTGVDARPDHSGGPR